MFRGEIDHVINFSFLCEEIVDLQVILMDIDRSRRLVNLTSNDIWISPTIKIPSEGELKLVISSINYPEHHIHYFNEPTNIEVGIPVLPWEKTELDQKSLGYEILKS